jgi:hypothetical protein
VVTLASLAQPPANFLAPLRGALSNSYNYLMLKTDSDTLHTGDSAPDFALPTADRTIVRSSEFRGKPLVIVFIRGTW